MLALLEAVWTHMGCRWLQAVWGNRRRLQAPPIAIPNPRQRRSWRRSLHYRPTRLRRSPVSYRSHMSPRPTTPTNRLLFDRRRQSGQKAEHTHGRVTSSLLKHCGKVRRCLPMLLESLDRSVPEEYNETVSSTLEIYLPRFIVS